MQYQKTNGHATFYGVLDSRFYVINQVGDEGGNAVVWRAWDAQ